MAKLTPKQEAFCLAHLETGIASEAYRRSYKTEKMKEKQIWEEASKLLKNPKVAQRLKELREPAVKKAMLTLERHLERLEKLSRGAELDKQFSAAISAEVARGKAAGIHIEKFENTNIDKTVNFIEAKDE